ncbi:MAG: F0F1 ATP synthase subunit alpha [Verrucomicrobia bacterium]|jgi:F-type H+/Na+-transporting ATPase subunit alpha|nr:F0F1 ATP synthase subunit alpha [Verrucomicrobiota bacterium]MBT7067005.1 F0F1 ATP synthase subunit alpha [Verrucomicrobiota bacterium]MBT7701160.1 F0F1 ATP synthase subunit alpha [Verrucomicrobiota bacterium]
MSRSLATALPLFKIKVHEKGVIKDIKEIIVRITGLPTCLNGQIVDLGNGVNGIIMGYDEDDVLVLVLGDQTRLRMGKEVTGASEPFKIPVGDRFIGRMVTALGEPCDQGEPVEQDDMYAVFRDSAPITWRAPVEEFIPTGTKMIDIAIPLAKGQRQLILGDRMTGKTVIAVDAILNQLGRDVVCIFCCVGKSLSGLSKIMSVLKDGGALDYTCVMVATDNAPVGEQYLVPFAAASMGEYFALKGRDVLVVFDDLTKHAWAYRQLSLLLERPPGREAYPGDIFYVQTQLMERAGRFNEAHGGASMTFLGIAETLQGDLTGFIPSNLASMCDGQIFLSSSIFAEGVRPAIDITTSLSIIGGRVQSPLMRELTFGLRADFAHYNEVLALSRLQSGLSDEAQKIVDRGQAISSIFIQMQYAPVPMADQVLLLFGLREGVLNKMSDVQRHKFNKEFPLFVRERFSGLYESLPAATELTAELEQQLKAALDLHMEQLGSSHAEAGSAE